MLIKINKTVKSEHPILVTKKLSRQQLKYADILGLEPVVQPALEFKYPSYWDQILKAITEHRKACWIFTNSNAVSALKQLIDKGFQVNPRRTVYTVGLKLKNELEALGIDAVMPHIQDAKHLAEMVIDEQEKGVLYFQGNLSWNTVTDTLDEAGIDVTELEVYETIVQSVALPDFPVEGILFYSAGAVEGFRRGAGFGQELPPLFAIDQATAGALQAQTDQLVEVADRPDTKVMLQAVLHQLAD